MDDTGNRAVTTPAPHYSFPVLTGISANEPLSVREARMKIYQGFVSALDANGENISRKLSEVDLSNPEDVRAIIPDLTSHGSDILVHFGEERFLERYHQYQEHLAEWRTQYPKLASVDMRYERQVVLEMQPGSAVPTGDSAPAVAAVKSTAPVPVSATTQPAKNIAPAPNGNTVRKKRPAVAAKPKGKPAVAGAASQGAPR
jgi:cell division protein FtsQ